MISSGGEVLAESSGGWSGPNAACRIRHSECSLCLRPPSRQTCIPRQTSRHPRSRRRHRFHLNGTARAVTFPTLHTAPLKTWPVERYYEMKENIYMKGYRLLAAPRPAILALTGSVAGAQDRGNRTTED
jgi:hypothetical protein